MGSPRPFGYCPSSTRDLVRFHNPRRVFASVDRAAPIRSATRLPPPAADTVLQRHTLPQKPTQPCKSISETTQEPGDQGSFCCGWVAGSYSVLRSQSYCLCLGCSLSHVELLSCTQSQELLLTTPSGQCILDPGIQLCHSSCLCFGV